ncbi:MAG: PIG-L family deacetylase, partial [Anaerolineales bacterium]|nr:PIG-L family deacetylase [Anaerolineales bacterium]
HPDDESFGPGGTLARYATQGVDVHIAIATDGAAGSVAEGYEESRAQLAAIRAQELDAAVDILGGTLHRLNYRDSGMSGDPSNEHPKAFINADEYEAIGRVVKLIRETRPQVVITHDETGGYFHPDHIMCWKIVTPAFHAAADPHQYPELGLPPFQPQRLYYTAIPSTWRKFISWMYRLRGKDPTKVGRNQDIDMTKLGIPSEKIHAHIDIRKSWEIKRLASSKHATQGGGTAFGAVLPNWVMKQLLGRERFIRAYPAVPDGYRERDLFGSFPVNASHPQPEEAKIPHHI